MSGPQSSANIFNVNSSSEGAPRPVCYRHHGTNADATCFTCLKAICRVCTMQDFEGAQCVSCAARKRNLKKGRALGIAISAVIAGTIGVTALSRFEMPYDYGKHRPEIRQLEEQLRKTPCDRKDILRLTELMLQAGNEPGVVERANEFFTECKDWPRLRWVTYGAYKRSGQYDLAAAEATRLIEDGPEDKDFRWWRGMAYELKGDPARAAVDYAQAIALQPTLSNIPFNLASMLEQAGRPCEGIRPIEQFLAKNPKYADDDTVLARAERLHARCPGLRGEGEAALTIGPGGYPRATVLAGETPLVMDVDDDSTYVIIRADKAAELGALGLGEETFILASEHGVMKGRIGTVPLLKVGKATARNVAVAVVEKLRGDTDGLLGLSFLSRFETSWDTVACPKGDKRKQCSALLLSEREVREDLADQDGE